MHLRCENVWRKLCSRVAGDTLIVRESVANELTSVWALVATSTVIQAPIKVAFLEPLECRVVTLGALHIRVLFGEWETRVGVLLSAQLPQVSGKGVILGRVACAATVRFEQLLGHRVPIQKLTPVWRFVTNCTGAHLA